MSSLRGGRGSGRGSGLTLGQNASRQPRPGFQTRGRGTLSTARAPRGMSRGRGTGRGRGAQGAPQMQTPNQTAAPTTGDYNSRFQQLKTRRETERKDAIRNGFLADPDRPRTLAEAITPVGTCPDMCAEFERLERIVQKDVWAQETREDGSPDEARMVKKFRRAAAGIDEQLPSDLRPPQTLKKTCDYLFDELIGDAESLGTVHHFVWDRTRAIRNDFSIQQITKLGDVEIAIDCYERIARFHILSLHQFAVQEKPYDKYDWYQEREQLDRTLLSLMQYYEDNRDRVNIKNEAEFRAYCIIFQIQDPIPDLEDRVSCYPSHIKIHPRVRTSLELYAAACNILDPQGPLKPREAHPIAREDWNAFFKKVESNQVSYLMACVAEIYFNMVRKQTLNAIWRSFRRQGNSADITDFSLDYLTDLLRFDDFDQTRDFCEHYSFGFKETADGQDEYLDLNSVQGKTFPEAAQGLSAQIFSQSVVENKRMGRTFSSVIDGKSFGVAKSEGLIVEEDMNYDGDMQMDDDSDSLFVPMHETKQTQQAQPSIQQNGSAFSSTAMNGSAQPSNPFQKTTTSTSNPFQTTATTSNPFAKPPQTTQSDGAATPPGSPFAAKKTPGLSDSIFAKAPPSSSPFSSFGKPSTSSAWSKPVAPDPANSNTKNASIFSQPAPTPQSISDSQQSNQQTPKVNAVGGFTSIHASSGVSWTKPSTSTWSTPISGANSNKVAQATTTSGTSTTPSSESVFSKPTTQQGSPFSFTQPAQSAIFEQQKALPTFDFAKPAAPQLHQEQQKPEVTFAAPVNINSEQSKADNSPSVFKFAPIPQSNNKPTEQPGFTFPQPTSEKPQQTTKQTFNFPSAQTSSPLKAPDSQQTPKPLFSFSPQPAPPPQETPKTMTTSQPPPQSSPFIAPNAAPSNNVSNKPFTFAPIGQQQQSAPPQQQKPDTQQQAPSQLQQQPTSAQPSQQQQPISIPRSPSFSQPNQPKKRSPLSQSFTAEEEQQQTGSPAPVNFDTPPKRTAFSSTPQSSFKQPTTSFTPQQATTKQVDPQAILTRLATEMVTDPHNGLLKQFIEFNARPIILSVYEQLYAEEMRELADNFRKEKLAKKYGRRWRETTWRLRLARQGKEKREKRRTARRDRVAADEVKRRKIETDAVDDFLKRQSVRVQQASVDGGSPSASFSASRRSSVASQSTVNTEPAAYATGRDSVRNKIKDPRASRVDGSGRIVKPSTPAPTVESSAKKSHFLGFSVPKQRSIMGSDTPRQSSRSAYFRMKALGLNPNGATVSTPMGPPPLNLKKRAREDDEADLEEASPPPKKSRTPPEDSMRPPSRLRSSSNATQSSVLELSPGASTTGSRRMSRLDLGEDDILARARAARQAFRDSTRSHRSTARHDDAMSITMQEETPVRSVQHARLRAAERAEQNLAQSVMRPDVPAYRFRESRFVPREKYGLAIERARENMERRSRAGSVAIAVDQSLKPPEPEVAGSSKSGSAMSVQDEPTPTTTRPAVEDVEMSQTFTRSRSPSERLGNKDSMEDEMAVDEQPPRENPHSQQLEPQSAVQRSPSPEPQQPESQQPESQQPESQQSVQGPPQASLPSEIPAYHPPVQPPSIRFGFGQYQPPQPSSFGAPSWSFRGINSPTTTNDTPEHEDQPVESSFASFGVPSEQIDTHPIANFGTIDTQTISDSPYLRLGNDSQSNGEDHFSMYPELHGGQDAGSMHPDVAHDQFIPNLMDAPDNQFLNDAARVALGLDSSINPAQFPPEPITEQPDEQSYHDEQMEDIGTNGFPPVNRQEREESQIDPSLLEDQPAPAPLDIEESHEEIVHETQVLKEPEMTEVRTRKSVVSTNSFAALASASSDRGESPAPTSPDRALDEQEDEGSDTERDEPSILRQPDDDTFIPNGIIQDVLAQDQDEMSDIQDAQRNALPEVVSFSSAAAPVAFDGPEPAVDHQLSTGHPDADEAPAPASSPPPPSLEATPRSKKPRPTPPALEVYQPPRTRSKSRDLSAPPTPSVTTRAAAREGSARPASRNGVGSASPARSLRSGRGVGSVEREISGVGGLPAVEEDRSEEEKGEDEDAGEEVGDEQRIEKGGDEAVGEDDEEDEEMGEENAGRDIARRALEAADIDEEQGGEMDGDDEEELEEEVEGDEVEDGDTTSERLHSQIGEEDDEEGDGFDEEGEEGSYDEEEEFSDEEDGSGYSGYASRGLTPGQMQESGLIKGGTGQTVEDAFELSD